MEATETNLANETKVRILEKQQFEEAGEAGLGHLLATKSHTMTMMFWQEQGAPFPRSPCNLGIGPRVQEEAPHCPSSRDHLRLSRTGPFVLAPNASDLANGNQEGETDAGQPKNKELLPASAWWLVCRHEDHGLFSS